MRTDWPSEPPGRITETDFGYTGQRAMDNLGLMDYRARFYDPTIGRFIQPDTIVPGYSYPQSWNRYSYVMNNPVQYRDPSGHAACIDDDGNGGCIIQPTWHGASLNALGIKLKGDFSVQQKRVIQQAASDVAYRLWLYADAGSPADAFRMVFGPNMTFAKVGKETCGAGAWACTVARDQIDIAVESFYSSESASVRLIVHELGHAFDLYVCATRQEGCGTNYGSKDAASHDLEGKLHTCSPTTVDGSDCLGREGYGGRFDENPFWGFAGGMNDWRFSVNELNSTYEVFADMFVGWTYDTWDSGSAGNNRGYYMNTVMPGYLR